MIPLMLICNDICRGSGRLCSILYVNSVFSVAAFHWMRPDCPFFVRWWAAAQRKGTSACVWEALFFDHPRDKNSCHAGSPGSSTTTRGWTPAGSWTGWWWPTWAGPTCASSSPATTGWVGRKGTTCTSETCWAAWIPWMSPNVGRSGTSVGNKLHTNAQRNCSKKKGEWLKFEEHRPLTSDSQKPEV